MYCNFILMYFILFIRVVFLFFFFKAICKTFLNVGCIKKVKEKKICMLAPKKN